ncbi:hypothetical protein PIB30_058164 [Stylosanthes scabra]|uniref:Retrotransposon gag domain-containing protein n=1 Tax=Stylosanthes scabra TaxID=79078 RepID=A0ABU6RK07_9FABA|nr:hypothetical protein [Stylosanthes scabra]
MEDEIPINNEGGGENNHPRLTPEKEVDQRNQTIQQLETALRELLERQTREAVIASEAVKKAKELAKKQQAVLDEVERREKDRQEKMSSRVPTMMDHDSKTAESKDHTYPVEIEPHDGTTDPKHHLDAFENRMLLVNAFDAIQCKAFTITLKMDALTIECFSDLADSFMKNITTRRRLPKTCLNLYSIVQKPEETLRSYLDRFNTEYAQIEGLQSHAALIALKG